MLSVNQAESIILNLVQPLDSKIDQDLVNLPLARGRILAESVRSNLNFPHWDNSAMDGYAVRFEDVANCSQEKPILLEIIEEIPAGYQPKLAIKKGQAARIFTGGCMPEGADTVVMQEQTNREGNFVTIGAEQKQYNFVRYQGSFYQAGADLLSQGIKLGAPEIGVLAAIQCVKIPVYRRPKVVIFSTGNELVSPEEKLEPGQLVDSNRYALVAALEELGVEIIKLGIVRDNKEDLQKNIDLAFSIADMVISTGGVSVGDYDYVEEVLTNVGAKIHVKSVAIKPGKPLTFATFTKSDQSPSYYFGLPGNPVSALVCFWRFFLPALAKFSGINQSNSSPQFITAKANQYLHSDGKRETYLWGKLNFVDGIAEFNLAGGSQNSANLINLAETNSLAIIPVGEKLIKSGSSVKVLVSHFN